MTITTPPTTTTAAYRAQTLTGPGHLAARPPTVAPLPGHANDWTRCIDRWADHCAAQGLSALTVARHVAHCRHLAGALADRIAHPADVTVPDLADYLTARIWAPTTYRNNVKSLRVFFAWLATAHGLAINPAAAFPLDAPDPAGMTRRARLYPERRPTGPAPDPVPAAWAEWIDDWTRYACAAGTPTTTRATRIGHMRRLARDLDPLTPTGVTIEDLIDWMAEHDWATETRRGHRATLRVLFAWAAATGHREDNPAAYLPRVKVGHALPRPASEDAYATALDAADDRAYLALRLAAEVGMRRAETAGVHTDDLIALPAGGSALIVHGKGNRTRVVPLPADLGRLLLDRPRGYVFPGDDNGHLSPKWVGKIVAGLLPAGTTMHQLRHRFATRAYAATGDLLGLQNVLGHASSVTTERYVALDACRLRGIVESVGGPAGRA